MPKKTAKTKVSDLKKEGIKNDLKNPITKDIPQKNNKNKTLNEQSKEPFYIACIGASAGGLNAITQFLKDFPADSGVALIFIQHLSDSPKSILTQILAKRTTLPVSEAENNMIILPNNLYVVPSGKNMTLDKDGKLKLSKRSSKLLALPIDGLFFALANIKGAKAIGVVLSGAASDGTLGLKAIQEAGGISFAQSEDSSEYPSMPHHAAMTGAADYILPPEAIAKKIIEIAKFKKEYSLYSDTDGNNSNNSDQEEAYVKILQLINSSNNVDFTYYRPGTIKRRIERRMVLNKIQDLPAYAKVLEGSIKETDQLYQDLLIHVTEFFRDPEAFESLKIKIFPAITLNKAKDSRIRIWVPGCSTGEEVYSLAISLLEYMDDNKKYFPIQIFGTDLSEEILIKARRGIYPEDIKGYVSPSRLQRFFVRNPTDNTYQIIPTVRNMCIFAKHNVIKDTPFTNLDLISCRNVLIYLDSVLQQRTFPIFHFALSPDRFLFLGNSESATKFQEYFAIVDRTHKIFKRKQASGMKLLNYNHSQGNLIEVRADIALRGRKSFLPEIDIGKKADELILNKYSPAGVLLNEDYAVVQYRGNVEKFVRHPAGNVTHHIIKTVRKELLPRLLEALLEAKKKDRPVHKEKVAISFYKEKLDVTIDVVPISLGTGLGYLVLFTDSPRLTILTATPKGKNIKDFEVSRLEEELASTAENLHAVIESQEVANEELRVSIEETMSANEELQSINEELETMKEELESSNEELTTLNTEVVGRNEELVRLQEARRALIKTVEGKDEFISILAHELRNPLTPILHTIEFIKLDRANDVELLKNLKIIERQSNNISLILKGLLDTSRAMQGKIALETTTIDIKKIIEHALETTKPLLLHSGHTLEVEWMPKEKQITGDALRLEQVFVNLLSNAIKYTEQGGKIRLKVSEEGGDIVVSIKDNGIGISPEIQTKIFSLFMQGAQNDTRIKGGLGVGLMLSRLLVELHNGTLNVKSEGEGKGSEFIVHLPQTKAIAGNHPDQSHADFGHAKLDNINRKRVLVIDDHVLLADTFAKLLHALNQDVRVAYDAESASSIGAEFVPEVVFMDLSMPIVDGFELVKHMKKLPELKDTYFIALTGMGDKKSVEKAMAAGFNKHLMKPVGAAEIMKAMEGAKK